MSERPRVARSRPVDRRPVDRVAKFSINCAASQRRRKICEHCFAKLNSTKGMQMRTGIGIAVVVAIGLIWSVNKFQRSDQFRRCRSSRPMPRQDWP